MLKIEYLNNERFESQIKTVTSSIDPLPRYQVHWTGMVMPRVFGSRASAEHFLSIKRRQWFSI